MPFLLCVGFLKNVFNLLMISATNKTIQLHLTHFTIVEYTDFPLESAQNKQTINK